MFGLQCHAKLRHYRICTEFFDVLTALETDFNLEKEKKLSDEDSYA